MGRNYSKKSTYRRVSAYFIIYTSIKNSKPFRISKNGNRVDVIKKVEPNVIHINIQRNNVEQNQNRIEQNDIEIADNSNFAIDN